MNRLVIEALAAVAIAIAAFLYGSSMTADRLNAIHEAQVQAVNMANAQAHASLVEQMRTKERQHADDMAALDAKYTKELTHERAEADRIIADLRTDVVRVRDEFTCAYGAAQGGAGKAGTSTSLGDGRKAGGLQKPHVEFLLSEAGRADEVVKQLQACQAIVRQDRWQQ